MEPLKKTTVPLPPLRKQNAETGTVYSRFPKVEAIITELLALPQRQAVLRCEIEDEDHADFVPSECLVYLVRSFRNGPANSHFERLYKGLMKRIFKRLPDFGLDGKKIDLEDSRIREGVVDVVQELLALDRSAYEERLDFWEVRFGMALKLLRITIEKKVRKETKRQEPLENPDTGEIATHVLDAAGVSKPFDAEELSKKIYRERLPVAIESLSPDKKRIIQMSLKGFPIDSNDPDAITISKALNLSEKTVRTRMKEALVALKRILEKGDAR